MPPSPTVLNAMRVPSREMPMRLLKLAWWNSPSGITMANLVRLRGAEPRYRLMANAVAVAVPATTPAMAPIASRRVMTGLCRPARSSGLAPVRASSNSIRTSPMSRRRCLGSFCRQRRNRRRTSGGVASRQPIPGGLACEDRGDRVRHRVAHERRPSGQHFEEHASERPDVGALVHRPAPRLFRPHVGGGAENHPRCVIAGVVIVGDCRSGPETVARRSRLGQPEVQHLHRPSARTLIFAGFRSR